MKKVTVCIMTAVLAFTFFPGQAKAAPGTASISISAANITKSAEANTLLVRLNEIKALDKSNMSTLQKKELRTEVQSIRQNLRDMDGGIYLSIGAVILIVILLVILL